MSPLFDCLRPELLAGLPHVVMPIVDATAAPRRGYGRLIDNPQDCAVETVRWAASGKRPIDEDTGDQGGTTEGVFVAQWQGDVLFGRNEAVGVHYLEFDASSRLRWAGLRRVSARR